MQGWSYVYTGANEPFEAREFPVPEVEADGILVRVTVSSICGSDLHGWHGDTPRKPVTIMGHEMTGRVERLGGNVKADAAGQPLAEGDRIVYSYFYPCHHCQPCLANDGLHCDSRRIGAGRSTSDKPPHFTGAYAEYFYLRPGHFVLRTPDDLSDRVVAPLNCALAQVIYGLEQVSLTAGETVVIQGAGGLGLYAAAVAREAGAANIIVTGLAADHRKLELARRFGAHHTVDVQNENAVQRVREITNGRGADVVVDVSSYATEPVVQALDFVAFGGTVVLAGTKGFKAVPNFISDKLVMKEITLRGAIGVTSSGYANAIRLLEARSTPIEEMHTHRFALQDAELAIQTLAREIPGEESIHSCLIPDR